MNNLALSRRSLRLLVNLYLARFSPKEVEGATRQVVRIALCGSKATIESFRHFLTGKEPDEPVPSLSLHALPCEEPSNHWHLLEDCQMGVVLLTRDELLGDAIYRVRDALPKGFAAVWGTVGAIEPWLQHEVGEIARDLKIGPFTFVPSLADDTSKPLLDALVKQGAAFDLAMGRKFERLRDSVASRAIRRVARSNLSIALLSALPATLPGIGPIASLLGVTGEIVFITSNQLKLVLQLASLYGFDVRSKSRVNELLPIVGSAFGWRVLSRQAAGLFPAIGPGLKGAVAYAGTVACGAAAQWYYKTGTYLDEAAQEQVYQQALLEAAKLEPDPHDLQGAPTDASTLADPPGKDPS